MDITYLITSIFAESTGKTIDKLNFKKNKIDPRQSLLVTFAVMTLSVLIYVIITGQSLPSLSLAVLALMIGIALFSFGGNVFDEVSLQKTDLSLREPLVDFEPVVTGLLAYALFPEERNPVFLVAFVLCALIVNWGIHRRKLRRSQIKGMFYLWIAVILYAIVPIFYKEALDYMSPEYIALFRLSSIFVLLIIFFRPKRHKRLTSKMIGYSTTAGLAYAVGAVVSIYAIQVYGLVLTMLFLMLGPALRYLAGQLILHEKVRRGEVLSSLMLTIVVAVAAFMK
ncbi:MAG: DMT family transporter [Patescibacteria group bacterium]